MSWHIVHHPGMVELQWVPNLRDDAAGPILMLRFDGGPTVALDADAWRRVAQRVQLAGEAFHAGEPSRAVVDLDGGGGA